MDSFRKLNRLQDGNAGLAAPTRPARAACWESPGLPGDWTATTGLWSSVLRPGRKGLALAETKGVPGTPKAAGCFRCSVGAVDDLPLLLRPGTPWYHRLYWCVALVLAVGLWTLLAQQQLERWMRAPVIVTMETAPRRITDLPMPAVTLCTSTANVDPGLFNYSAALQRYTGQVPPPLSLQESMFLTDVAMLCRETVPGHEPNITDQVTDSIQQFGVQNLSCEFASSQSRPVCSLITGSLPGESGLCHVHNSLPGHLLFRDNTPHRTRGFVGMSGARTAWTPDRGYSSQVQEHLKLSVEGTEFPRRVRGPGADLRIFYRLNFSLVGETCRMRWKTMQVVLHHPADVAAPGAAAFPMAPGEWASVVLSPSSVSTANALRSWYSPHQRRCYFQDERPLRFFALYTQRNCEYECLINLTVQRCGCVPFYVVHGSEAPLCPEARPECFRASQALMSNETLLSACDCLDSCVHLEFGTEVAKEPYINPNADVIAMMRLYFRNRYFRAYARTEVFGVVDLIANLGGLMGLCLGMSLMGVADLLFHLVNLVKCRLNRVVPLHADYS